MRFLENQGLQATSIEVKHISTNKQQHIGLVSKASDNLDIDNLNLLLYIKDKFGISDEAYRALCSATDLPSINQLKKKQEQIKQNSGDIVPTPTDSVGFQRDFVPQLKQRIAKLQSAGLVKIGDEIRVKFSGDGTWIGKTLHVVNFTFTIINDPEAMSSEGNCLSAIFQDSEGYEALTKHLADVKAAMEQSEEVSVGGHTYKVSYYLGGDYKFLLCVLGIDSASCTHSCIYCTCPSSSFHTSDSLSNTAGSEPKCRTVADIEACAKLPKKSKKKFNCSNPPIFPSISISHVVIDNLHLFLRIADTLINLLILDARRLDAIDSLRTIPEFDRLKYTYCSHLEKCFRDVGVVGFQFYVGRDSKKLKWPTLSGPQKHRLFSKVCVSEILPELDPLRLQRIEHLWSTFYEIIGQLGGKISPLSENGVVCFRAKVTEWFQMFLKVYQKRHVTPYIHVLVAHVPDLLARFGSIGRFTQQGLEKLNDVTTKTYFRSTNHKKVVALAQIMHKQNRMDYFMQSSALQLKSKRVSCSVCKERGHTKRTCKRGK